MKKTKKAFYAVTGLLSMIMVLFAFSCSKTNTDTASKKQAKLESADNVETIFAVNTTKVIKGEINDFIELNGDIKTKTEVDVYPDTMGKLVNLIVHVGEPVNKNQVIAYVDPSKPGMEFKLSPVLSTISGTITSLPIKTGSTVSQQIAIAKVGQLDRIEIITYVAEKFISKMNLGLKGLIKVEAYPDKVFEAKVTEVSPVVDPQSRMLQVKLELLDRNTPLKPGMFAEIKIITEKKSNIVKIPAECLIKRYGDYYVFIVERQKENEGVVRMQKVILGIQISNKVEIVDGLIPDQEIVVRGQTLLDDKAKVRVIETIQPITEKDNIN